MNLQDVDQSLAVEELRRIRLEDDPQAQDYCLKCGAKWRIADHGLLCPVCQDYAHDVDYAWCVKERLKIRAEKEAAAVAAEVAAIQKSAKQTRPASPRLDDVIGNGDAVAQIRTALDGFAFLQAKPGAPKWTPFPHLLLAGPGGVGKTFLAEIIARELKRKLHLQLGQTLATPGKVAEILLSLRPGEILFVDECHGLPVRSQEAFYRALEDGMLVPVTRAGQPVSPPVKIAPFTLIGATTDEWGLLPSMVQRFKYRIRLVRMTAAEIAQALTGRAERAGLKITKEAIDLIASRSLGTPRLAIGLLDGCLDTARAQAKTQDEPEITADIVQMTCVIWGIDSLGLDRTARQYLRFLAEAGGGPVRLNVLAAKLDGLSKTTVERKLEPDLLWLCLIEKQANGRILTQVGHEHLRKEKP